MISASGPPPRIEPHRAQQPAAVAGEPAIEQPPLERAATKGVLVGAGGGDHAGGERASAEVAPDQPAAELALDHAEAGG